MNQQAQSQQEQQKPTRFAAQRSASGEQNQMQYVDQRKSSREAGALQRQLDARASSEAPIQRRVQNFAAVTANNYSPMESLKRNMDKNHFSEDDDDIDNAIDNKSRYINNNQIPRAGTVTARVNRYSNQALPRGGDQTNIGHIGRDEMYIKFMKDIMVEGGHLIKHAYWQNGDHNEGLVNSFSNVVPQTRTMNMLQWSNAEGGMNTHAFYDYTITAARNTFAVPNKHIAAAFDLQVTDDNDIDTMVNVNEWIPSNLNVVRTKAADVNDTGTTDYAESGMYKIPGALLTTGDAAIGMLDRHGLLGYLSDDLTTSIGNIG